MASPDPRLALALTGSMQAGGAKVRSGPTLVVSELVALTRLARESLTYLAVLGSSSVLLAALARLA